MKIGQPDPKPPVPQASERKPAAVTGGPSPTQATEASAKLQLSPAATAVAGSAGDGSFDAKKVDRIAQAIRDGSFQVNAEAIADKLIVNAAELLGRKPN
ncbi:MAG: flagellar biosynthesis anti-sigma factor FlgM [Rubrivivax sp.]